MSARANALTLRSDLTAESLLHRLNAISPEIYFTAAAPVPPAFSVRRAERRIYRYFEPGTPASPELWTRAARLFRGRIDVRSFGRGVPVSVPQWRTVESVRIESATGGRIVEVRAPSFVWGMVRKIVGALREVEDGRLPLRRLEAAIAGELRLTLPLAEPEGLVLWSVEYPALRWESVWPGPNRHQATFVSQTRASVWRRESVLQALFALSPEGP